MEVNEGFRCGGDGGMNGRYSFKSLLLDDGEGVDEVGMEGAQFAVAGDLGRVQEAFYRDEVVSGRESFKSLLLDDDGGMDDDEIHFSPRNHELQNGNQMQSSVLSAAVVSGRENSEVFEDKQGIEQVEEAEVEETRAPPRKKRRENGNQVAMAVDKQFSSMKSSMSKDNGVIAEYRAEEQQESQPLRTVPPQETKKPVENSSPLPPIKHRKQGGSRVYSSDVQKLLDSVIARQEMFFSDLLESMERKEAIRERIREEKEERWRAEERAQLDIFNNAMLTLTQEILGDSGTGTQQVDRKRRSDLTDH